MSGSEAQVEAGFQKPWSVGSLSLGGLLIFHERAYTVETSKVPQRMAIYGSLEVLLLVEPERSSGGLKRRPAPEALSTACKSSQTVARSTFAAGAHSPGIQRNPPWK